jgi:hypothetical protein
MEFILSHKNAKTARERKPTAVFCVDFPGRILRSKGAD